MCTHIVTIDVHDDMCCLLAIFRRHNVLAIALDFIIQHSHVTAQNTVSWTTGAIQDHSREQWKKFKRKPNPLQVIELANPFYGTVEKLEEMFRMGQVFLTLEPIAVSPRRKIPCQKTM